MRTPIAFVPALRFAQCYLLPISLPISRPFSFPLMPRSSLRFKLCLALCCASLPALAHQAGAEQAGRGAVAAGQVQAAAASSVREAERQRAQALTQRDVDALRRLIAGDYYHVETNGRVRTKTEFLQALARDEYSIRAYGVDEMEIRIVDGGTAIVTGTYRVTTVDLPSTPQRGRYVRVWTRNADGWRNALHQGTQIRTVASHPADPTARALQ